MEREELLRLSDMSLCEFYRETARGSSRSTIWEADGWLLFAGAHPAPVLVNGAIRTTMGLPVPEALARADAFFRARQHGYAITIRCHADDDLEQAVRDAGFTLTHTLPAMVLDQRLDDRSPPTGVVVRRVDDQRGINDFADVVAACFESQPARVGMARAAFSEARSLLAPHVAAFVAYHNDAPVAVAMTRVSHRVAAVGWVATRPGARRQGIGEAVTRAATDAGFELGARIACLQASTLGEPLYRRLGYVEFSRYRNYVAPEGLTQGGLDRR